MGGIQWGSATDGRRIYVALANSDRVPFVIPSGNGGETTVTGGNVGGAGRSDRPDPVADPRSTGRHRHGLRHVRQRCGVRRSGAGTGDNMYALDARTGAIKWRFASGGSVIAGAAVVDGSVYWGSGYHIGTGNNKLYAFDLR
ncbi:PQQ-like beta-propeller repeat protein [Micromonospora sp. STR1s_5]|nr:PQQ-like beta-propeller repeat protein [Micromonospora sp. STR1s_5]